MASSRFGCKDGFTLAGRMCDRRARARMHAARVVQVAHDGDAAYARCCDLSDTGMKLDLTAPLELNDYVTVALSPSIVLCGKVAWIDGRECGIAFDCPVDSEALLDAAEPAPRPPQMPAMAALLGGRQAAPVCAVQPQRPAPKGSASFQPGLAVTVVTGPGREQRGVVRWATDAFAALELEEEPIVAELPPPPCKLLPAPEGG